MNRHKTVCLCVFVSVCHGSSDQVFGCRLEMLCEREKSTVPRFVRLCTDAVERRGNSRCRQPPLPHDVIPQLRADNMRDQPPSCFKHQSFDAWWLEPSNRNLLQKKMFLDSPERMQAQRQALGEGLATAASQREIEMGENESCLRNNNGKGIFNSNKQTYKLKWFWPQGLWKPGFDDLNISTEVFRRLRQLHSSLWQTAKLLQPKWLNWGHKNRKRKYLVSSCSYSKNNCGKMFFLSSA